jgi:hypothetical protein
MIEIVKEELKLLLKLPPAELEEEVKKKRSQALLTRYDDQESTELIHQIELKINSQYIGYWFQSKGCDTSAKGQQKTCYTGKIKKDDFKTMDKIMKYDKWILFDLNDPSMLSVDGLNYDNQVVRNLLRVIEDSPLAIDCS